MDLANFPLLENAIILKQALAKEHAKLFGDNPDLTSDQALEQVRRDFDCHGPFAVAKWNDALVNNSGEEFAIQFMTVYNAVHPGTY